MSGDSATVGPRSDVERAHAAPAGLAPLVVGALGVVYGDLGTSPLYSIREAFVGEAINSPSTA